MPSPSHESSPSDSRQARLDLPGLDLCSLIVLAVVVQTWCVTHATVPALDCVRFVQRAKAIEQLGPLSALAGDSEQPLFPLLIAAVHHTWQLFTPSGAIWAMTAQTTAAVCLVLCVVPLYCVVRSAHDRRAAIVGATAFCLLPAIARLGGDGTSDSLHLLLFTTALWASYHALTASGHRSIWCIATGTLIALAALTRAEALVLLPALGLTVIITRRAWQSSHNFRAAAQTIGYGATGLALVVVPYFYAAGVHSTRDVVDRSLGRPTRETTVVTTAALTTNELTGVDADAPPLVFAAREPGPSSRRRGAGAGLFSVTRELAEAFHYLAGVLVLLGMIAAMLSPSGHQRTWLTLVVCLAVCYLAAVWVLAAREGYLSARHLVPLVPATIGWLLGGAAVLAECITPARSSHHTRRFVAAGIVVVAILLGAPRTATPLHASRAAHRQASDWLADSARDAGTVLDTRGWTGLYTGRTTYDYTEAATAFADPALAYVVVQRREVESTSDRAATLRRLLDIAAEPVASFADTQDRPDRDVAVYRWHSGRLTAALISHELLRLR